MKKSFILMSLFALFIHVSCELKKESKHPETKFLVTNPIKKDTLITKDYVSQIHASQHIELRALEKGYLKQIFVDEGQHVKKELTENDKILLEGIRMVKDQQKIHVEFEEPNAVLSSLDLYAE